MGFVKDMYLLAHPFDSLPCRSGISFKKTKKKKSGLKSNQHNQNNRVPGQKKTMVIELDILNSEMGRLMASEITFWHSAI